MLQNILMYGGIYLAGFLGLSYIRGRAHPYLSMEMLDYMAIILWPVGVGLILLFAPIVLPVVGIIKLLNFISNMGIRHGKAKILHEQSIRQTEEHLGNIEFFEDDESVEEFF